MNTTMNTLCGTAAWGLGLMLALLGCAQEDNSSAAATTGLGSGGASVVSSSAVGGSGGASTGGGTGGTSGCVGPCAVNDLTLQFGGETVKLSRAQYGLTAPAQAASNSWEIYLEAHAGGSPSCPDASSPTPDYTVILAGLPAAVSTEVLTEADGLKVTLLDFVGTLLGNVPLSKAQTIRVTPTMTMVCTDCVGQRGDDDGYVALDIEATFAEGTLKGHGYATHCQSLDQP